MCFNCAKHQPINDEPIPLFTASSWLVIYLNNWLNPVYLTGDWLRFVTQLKLSPNVGPSLTD